MSQKGPFEVRVIRDVVFAQPEDCTLLLDLYLPATAAPAPCVVFIHGGGWRLGDRTLAPDLRRYFAECGYAMASIDHRRSTEAHFPAQVEDVKAAVRWLRGHAEEHAIDPTRIALWGSSSGGHLATVTGLSGPGQLEGTGGDLEQSSQVSAVVDGYGPVDFLLMEQHRDTASGPIDAEAIVLPPGASHDDPDSFQSLLIGAPVQQQPELARAASPLRWVRPDGPPLLIMHGTADATVGPAQSELLWEALRDAGAQATLVLIEGLGHGFFNRPSFGEGHRTSVRATPGKPDLTSQAGFDTVLAYLDHHLTPDSDPD